MNETQPHNSGLAIVALVTALCGVSLLGVIFGHVSLSQIKNSNGQLLGRGMALAGLIVGYVGMAIYLLWVIIIIAAIGSVSTV